MANNGSNTFGIRDNHTHCKVAGSEFTRAWNKTLQHGDQLFSYAQQIPATPFLCLYASNFDGNVLTYASHILAHRDNPKYLADNPHFKSFKDATDVKERYAVWRDTYKRDFTTKGIFEANIQPYHIGKDKYSLADLHAISAADQQKKYHEFATILRQHNFSGRTISKAVRSAGQNNINATKMRQIKIPVPSLSDQKRFVTEIGALSVPSPLPKRHSLPPPQESKPSCSAICDTPSRANHQQEMPR